MTINILLEATREQQIEIEEHCLNFGTSISGYLLGLHEVNMSYKKAHQYTVGTVPMPENMQRDIERHDEEIKLKNTIQENNDNQNKKVKSKKNT